MHYEEILKQVKHDGVNEHNTDLYRYNGLLEAIRYFSNRLTIDQITDAAFDFVNEILTVDKSVMYILQDDRYVLNKQRGIHQSPGIIPISPELSRFALYAGGVISNTNVLKQYFDSSLLKVLKAAVMLPLILDHKLYGFFLLSGRITGSFKPSDIVMCETLMNLFNNALESCTQLEKLKVSNHELDEKIFNLFAINQSAKAMLTEHRLDELYLLAVDVFSELTQSSNTGFVLYDQHSEKYVLKAYRDVFSNGETPFGYISLKPDSRIDPDHRILDLSNIQDTEYFNSLFPGGSEHLSELKAHYLVFICDSRQKILGFVTLGRTMTGTAYKRSAFELVDSLASYTYIALSNAMLIKVVNDQKTLLQKKLDRLTTLNRLSKNINSALDSAALAELTLETLSVSFGAESALIALYDEVQDALVVFRASDACLEEVTIPMNSALEPLKQGRTVFESRSENLPLLVGSKLAEVFYNNSGVLAVPMTLERYETHLVGALLIFRLNEGLLSDEENIMTFETVANQIAPLLEGFISLESRMKLLKRDMGSVFLLELDTQVNECRKYDFDLEILRIKDPNASPFCESRVAKLLSGQGRLKGIYPVSYNQTEIIVTQDFEYHYEIIKEALGDNQMSLQRFRFKKDFYDSGDYQRLK